MSVLALAPCWAFPSYVAINRPQPAIETPLKLCLHLIGELADACIHRRQREPSETLRPLIVQLCQASFRSAAREGDLLQTNATRKFMLHTIGPPLDVDFAIAARTQYALEV